MESIPSFGEVVEEVLGSQVAERGFAREDASPTRVTYRRDRTLLSFAHFVEDQPSPWVAIDVGLTEADGVRRMAGLWRAMADDDPARAYTTWRFEDRAALRTVLERFASEVMPLAWKVLDSERALENLLAVQSDESETHYLEDRRRVDLLHARRSFDEERWQEAIDTYVLLGAEALTAADRRRLHEARSHLRGDGTTDR